MKECKDCDVVKLKVGANRSVFPYDDASKTLPPQEATATEAKPRKRSGDSRSC